MKKATTKDLKKIIVDLKVALLEEKVPRGHCPYAYYDIGKERPNCNDIDCDQCKIDFYDEYRNKTEKQIENL